MKLYLIKYGYAYRVFIPKNLNFLTTRVSKLNYLISIPYSDSPWIRCQSIAKLLWRLSKGVSTQVLWPLHPYFGLYTITHACQQTYADMARFALIFYYTSLIEHVFVFKEWQTCNDSRSFNLYFMALSHIYTQVYVSRGSLSCFKFECSG